MTSTWRRFLFRNLLGISAALGIFLVVCWFGERLPAPAGAAGAGPSAAGAASGASLAHLLVALVAILVAARLFSALMGRIGQPAIIGEILAGIALGPSLLGALSPGAARALVPPETMPLLSVLAQLGVVLFMFVVGLEMNAHQLRGRERVAAAVSAAGIGSSFVLAGPLAWWLYPQFGARGVSFTVFALFLGLSLSVTAFPVLARILNERGLSRSPVGALALACAAVDDVSAWCLLALVVGVVHGRVEHLPAMLAQVALYAAAMLVLVRPVVRRLVARNGADTPSAALFATVLAMLLLSSLTTEVIGVHPLFGAFLFGALFPCDSPLALGIRARMEMLVQTLFLPIFFVYSGLRTHVGLLEGGAEWLACGAVVVVAFAGKLGGTWYAAVREGVPHREAATLGVLMNTRGLVELVVLNVGMDLGLISPTVFAMLVVMALVTTFATTPILQLLAPRPAAAPAAPEPPDPTPASRPESASPSHAGASSAWR